MPSLNHLCLFMTVLHSTVALPVSYTPKNDIWLPEAERTVLRMFIPRSTVHVESATSQPPSHNKTFDLDLDLDVNFNVTITKTTNTDIHNTNMPEAAERSGSENAKPSAGLGRLSKREPKWPKTYGYLRPFLWDDPPEDFSDDPDDILDSNGKERTHWHQFWRGVGDEMNSMHVASGWR